MGKFKDYMQRQLPSQRFNARAGDAFVTGYKLTYVDSKKRMKKLPTKGLTATVQTGAQVDSYVSKGAVGAGAVAGGLLFGPLGAIAGGLVGSTKRKGGGFVYIVVEKDGAPIGTIPVPAKEEQSAYEFVQALTASAADPGNE